MIKSKLALVVIIALVLAGCTNTQSKPIQLKSIDQSGINMQIPASWVELGAPWKSENVILAFADQTGDSNSQSIIVYKLNGIFNSDKDKFDQSFCDQYFELANANDAYDKPQDTIHTESIKYVKNDEAKTEYCEVIYNWQQKADLKVEYLDLVMHKDKDVFIFEASSAEGNDFDIAKNVAYSAKIQ